MTSQTHALGFRPTFTLTSRRDPDELAAHLAASLHPRATAAGPHLLLAVSPDQRRLWSPWLHIDIRPAQTPDAQAVHANTPEPKPAPESRSSLTCRFSPHPSVWTATMLTALALLTTAGFGAVFAVSQHLVGERPWAWWITVAAVLVTAGLWTGAQLAQRLARDQMCDLRDELLTLIDAEA